MSINDRIERLKAVIEFYIKSGGDIYAPKRELPYYEQLHGVVRAIRKETGNNNIMPSDVYKLCGIDYDKEFNSFKEFIAELKPLVSNLNADKIKEPKIKESKKVYAKLKNYADKYNTTPFDFFALMTSYTFSDCNIYTDSYEESLKYLLNKAYPSKNLSGIRRDNPELYEQLRQLLHYYKEPVSMSELVSLLGFSWPEASTKLPAVPDKKEVIKELKFLYPSKDIINLREQNYKLYMDVIRVARSEGKTASDWLEEKGFSYPSAVSIPKLSQIKVDARSRKELLTVLKQKAFEKMEIKPQTEQEMFRASLEASLKVIKYLNGLSAKEVLILTDKLVGEACEM